jgi:hypothetical protein
MRHDTLSVCVTLGKKQFIKWKILGYLSLKISKDNSPMPVWNSPAFFKHFLSHLIYRLFVATQCAHFINNNWVRNFNEFATGLVWALCVFFKRKRYYFIAPGLQRAE